MGLVTRVLRRLHGRVIPWNLSRIVPLDEDEARLIPEADFVSSSFAVRYVWLQRRDRLRQAVSLAIAKQTGQWTSHFELRGKARYRYTYVRRSLNAIHAQEDLIAAFLHDRALSYETIFYEELVRAPGATLKAALGVDIGKCIEHRGKHALRRQANAMNDRWVSRLARQMLELASVFRTRV